jgi:NTP pyrophosphatase (non-canonical NTP hydrolase)
MAEDISHPDLVRYLKKPGDQLLAELGPQDVDLWHMATGVASEGGELLDQVKQAVVYRKPLDMNNVIEELGDLEFFMEGVRQILGLTREQTLAANIAKLSVRYKQMTYSNESAQSRADKAVDEA